MVEAQGPAAEGGLWSEPPQKRSEDEQEGGERGRNIDHTMLALQSQEDLVSDLLGHNLAVWPPAGDFTSLRLCPLTCEIESITVFTSRGCFEG